MSPAAGRTPARAPKVPGVELLKREKVMAARRTIAERRAATGTTDVTQADVDLAADVLVGERLRPYPRAIVLITGGSLSTVTPLLEDWFVRFAMRNADPNSPFFDLPMKVGLHTQLLVAQLVAAVREQLRHLPDPTQALIAAAQLGEHQALRKQVTELTQERERLWQQLAALTHQVAELQSRVQANLAGRSEHAAHLEQAMAQLNATLLRLQEPSAPPESALEALAQQVKRLALKVHPRPRAKLRAVRPKRPRPRAVPRQPTGPRRPPRRPRARVRPAPPAKTGGHRAARRRR